MDPETVANWLREGGDVTAAEVVRHCEFKAHYVDTGFPMDGGPEIDIFELQIGVPRRVFDRLSSDLKNEAASIEKAIEDLSRGDHCWVRRVEWVARVYTAHASPSDSEVEDVLKTFDTDHVRSAWSKALARRTHDLEGAITAAKTLLEAVCKHILKEMGAPVSPNADVTVLYHGVSNVLGLSASSQADKTLKRILGNCQAVVQGIAELRNQFGDAHARDPQVSGPSPAMAELAVNLAGGMATFLTKCWHAKKEKDTEPGAAPNGGPATPVRDPEVSEGPPSVS